MEWPRHTLPARHPPELAPAPWHNLPAASRPSKQPVRRLGRALCLGYSRTPENELLRNADLTDNGCCLLHVFTRHTSDPAIEAGTARYFGSMSRPQQRALSPMDERLRAILSATRIKVLKPLISAHAGSKRPRNKTGRSLSIAAALFSLCTMWGRCAGAGGKLMGQQLAASRGGRQPRGRLRARETSRIHHACMVSCARLCFQTKFY